MALRILAGSGLMFAIAACAEQEFAGSDADGSSRHAGVEQDVERIIQNFTGRRAAQLTINSVDGEIVCGEVAKNGGRVNFYVDLVDEEVFFSEGLMAAAVDAAC